MTSFIIRNLFFGIGLLTGSFFLFQFSSCSDDEKEEPIPVNQPVADFNYSATRDLEVPTTVTFTNISTDADSYFWDFDNGETSTAFSPSVEYTEPKDAETPYVVTLIANSLEGGGDTTQQSLLVKPLMMDTEMYGKWTIMEEEWIIDGMDPVSINRPANWSTLEFNSDGTYQRINMTWAEWETGNWGNTDSTLWFEPLEGNSSMEGFNLEFLIEGFFSDNEDNYYQIRTKTEIDVDGTPIEIVADLGLHGSEIVWNSQPLASIPTISEIDLTDKWSFDSHEFKLFSESDSAPWEFNIAEDEEIETDIPYNYFTLELKEDNTALVIDNWIDGIFLEGVYQILDGSNLLVTTEGVSQLIQITKNDDATDIELIVAGFQEEGAEELKFHVEISATKNDGSDATITRSEMVGDWEVLSVEETIDDSPAPPENQVGPPVGAIISFFTNGTADVGEPDLANWEMIDGSNFTFTFPDDEVELIHITDYDDQTNMLSAFQLQFDDDDSRRELRLDLEKKP